MSRMFTQPHGHRDVQRDRLAAYSPPRIARRDQEPPVSWRDGASVREVLDREAPAEVRVDPSKLAGCAVSRVAPVQKHSEQRSFGGEMFSAANGARAILADVRHRDRLVFMLAATAAVAVTACSTSRGSSPAPGPAPVVRAVPAPGNREACEAASGVWDDNSGRGHVTGCNMRTRDRGKACTDSAQCEGACMGDASGGQCSEFVAARGCGILIGGRVLCVD